jgi:hypothetical protein|tara:strand:+ start:1435 stop:1686 length:252 start_codon:yes stop_codon:yes gene_type:complete
MSEVVVDEMPELPNNVTVDKPIPSHFRLKGCIFLEHADTNDYHAYRYKSSDKSVENIDQKSNLVDFGIGLFENQAQDRLKNKK